MKDPLISIILPVFNGERYLAKAINSCLEQTYETIEVIVVNDFSTDNTLTIVNEFVAQDKRVRLINNSENKKLPASLNIGHKEAKGEYITWTSDDNIYQKDAIYKMYTTLMKSNSDIVYCDYLIIDDEGIITGQAKLKAIEYLMFYGVIGACFLYKKEVYDRNKGYNEKLFLVEDYDFWLRAMKHSSYCKVDNPGYYFYRYHENSLTTRMKLDQNLKNQFLSNLYELYNDLFADSRMKAKEQIITFLINRFVYGPNDNIDVIHSKTFLKDLEYASTLLIGFSVEKFKRIVADDIIETIMIKKEFQKPKSFFAVHRLGKDVILRLAIGRYLALIKKCFL
ncbi:glycosyltransferase family 2 protein [Flavobacterium sp. MDT1-60]|uniref:glycosyltransferase family 2 protein n=1 Tax=Flavobacterium sp. MDT1-60 TaxID=1979344 RepID=UPI00177FAD1B|nr:glycosyltransferase family 2 protein [Flavobacterium sp. MDT1-60]QOG03809.1 glycosyltransferase family 2 protein [Flavobacterium sp. MDT1-60]